MESLSRRPCNRWVDQIWRDNNLPPADLWRRIVNYGHRGRRYSFYWLNIDNDDELFVTEVLLQFGCNTWCFLKMDPFLFFS